MFVISPEMAHFSAQRGFLGVLPPDSDEAGNPLDTLGIFMQSLKDMSAHLSNNGRKFEIHCAYKADDILNASASKYNDEYFLLVNIGIKFRMAPLFSALLSHSQIFTEIGNPDDEIPVVDNNLTLLQTGLDIASFPDPPKNMERKILASELAFIAEFLVIQHEMGHIINGHLDFLLDDGGPDSSIDEINNLAFQKFGGKISQTLEYDADCYAIQTLLNFFLSKGHVSDGNATFSVLRDDVEISEVGKLLKKIVFASYIYFRIIHEHHDSIFGTFPAAELGEIQNRSHPPAFFRNYITYNMVSSVLSRGFRIDETQFISNIEKGFIEAEAAWRLVTGSIIDNPFSGIYWTSSESLLKKYNSEWDSIKLNVGKFNWAGRLAP